MYKPVTVKELSTVDGFVSYARSFGSIMPVAIFIITTIQAIVPLIPFVILCSANSILFGMYYGILITWAATLFGASITFYMARRLGYEWAAKTYKRSNLKHIEDINGYRGFLIILAFRLLPYFPAPLINISAGVSKINFLWFFAASAIGKLPFIIGYALLGYSLLQTKNYSLGIGIMAALILVPYLIVRVKRRKFVNEKNHEK